MGFQEAKHVDFRKLFSRLFWAKIFTFQRANPRGQGARRESPARRPGLTVWQRMHLVFNAGLRGMRGLREMQGPASILLLAGPFG